MMDGESTGTADQSELAAQFEQGAIPLLDSLYGAARRLTRNPADAEDLVQEPMLKTYNNFHRYQPETHLRAWLYRIMHNTWIDHHRRSLSRPREHLSADIADWQHVARRDPHDSLRCRAAEVDVLEALPDRKVVEALEA